MKKIFFMALAALTVLVSCTKSEDSSKLSKVILTPSELTLAAGSSQTLQMSVEPSGAVYTTITWSSSNTAVATVTRKGSVTAVGAGNAVITCKVDDVEGKCNVTVTAVDVPVTGVELDNTSLIVNVGDTKTLTATIEPENATNKNVKWVSSDEAVATVAEGVVTGVANGKCKVVAITEDGGFKDTCDVKVTSPAVVNYVDLDGVWSKNTYPVFSTDLTKAYIVTLTTRKLVCIDLERAMTKWTYDLTNSTTAWAGNGGAICVNPTNGDIICANQCEVFAITAAGLKKWSIASTKATAATTHAALLGCGPAVSNDGKVIFAPMEEGLCALNAETGDVISTLSISTGSCQFAVYGDNRIVYHTTKQSTNNVSFITFNNNTLEVAAQTTSSINELSDITCPVISADQKKAFFFGKGVSVCVDLESQTISSTDTWTTVTEEGYPGHGLGWRWSGVLTEEGKLAYGTQWNGNTTAMIVLDSSLPLGKENGLAPYRYGNATGGNAAFNHQGMAADREGNFYCYINDYLKKVDEETAYYYLYRITFDGEAYHKQTVTKTAGAVSSQFQGCFAFGGNYFVAVHGNPGQVVICKVGEERAHSWGNGGDAQGTKNANNIK